jgi:hypothetical protein
MCVYCQTVYEEKIKISKPAFVLEEADFSSEQQYNSRKMMVAVLFFVSAIAVGLFFSVYHRSAMTSEQALRNQQAEINRYSKELEKEIKSRMNSLPDSTKLTGSDSLYKSNDSL